MGPCFTGGGQGAGDDAIHLEVCEKIQKSNPIQYIIVFIIRPCVSVTVSNFD